MSTPNILLITADDLGGDTAGSFGGRPDVMPTLDRLAGEGTRYPRAHVPIAVCQPSRSALLTGRWPHRNGAEGFEPIDDGVPLLTNLLASAGYRCGILGKVTHLQPVDRFGWDFIRDQPDLGVGRDPSRYGEAAAEFLTAAAAADRPWFLMANAHDPHRPFHASEQESSSFSTDELAQIPAPSRVFTPDEADPPGFVPDLPEVRQEYAEYLSSARRCDDVVAAVLAALDASGQACNTMVVFLSDNGIAFPFAKANCYLASTRTPLVIRWPTTPVEPHPTPVEPHPTPVEPVETTSEDYSFVSTLDLFPTFCELAGVPAPDDLDGASLVPGSGVTPPRDHVVTVFHETSGKRRYEMRCVQDETWGYIWNAWADGDTAYRAENMSGRTWPAMEVAATEDPELQERTDFYRMRAPEELYRLDVDPDARHNLVALDGTALTDEAATALETARCRLQAWMQETADPLERRADVPH